LLKSIIDIYTGNKIKVKINIKLSEEHTVNHGDRQGCPFSTTLFNTHMNEIIVKWNQIYIKGIILLTSTKLNTPLFTDKQVIIADSEDNLQKGIYITKHSKKSWNRNITSKS
jgi:hypothetical protein